MNWGEFIAIPNGTRVLNHSYDQCVALANLYHENVIGGAFVPVGSAFQWWTNFNSYTQLTSKYVQVSASSSPIAGDIFIARGGIYNARDGHIGVVVDGWNGSTFGTKEQNAEKNRYTYQTYRRNKSNILGFLRPKNNPAPQPFYLGDEEFMKFANDTDGRGYLVTEDGFYWLEDPTIQSFFKRLMKSTPDMPDKFYRSEIERMNDVLKKLRNGQARF